MRVLTIAFLLLATVSIYAQDDQSAYQLLEDISYYADIVAEKDAYLQERCKLDFYFPEDVKNFPTIVWFHGGGLKTGNKHIPEGLKKQGIAVVAVNYRFSPKVQAPVYIEDAAASVAWVFQNIEKYGGDPTKIILSGHSAGGYLASMVGMDKHWLAAHSIDANALAALIPFSGHTITHFTVREERNIPGTQPIIDDMAPLYHVRKDCSPLVLITGDREMELLGRYEENAYLMRMMKVVGHTSTELIELGGYGHDMVYPAIPILVHKVKELSFNH